MSSHKSRNPGSLLLRFRECELIYTGGITVKLRLLVWGYNLEIQTGLNGCGFITRVVGFYVYSAICYFYHLRWGEFSSGSCLKIVKV